MKLTWTLELDAQARKDMRKLPARQRARIIRFFDERVLPFDNPRRLGSPLKGAMSNYWRYRVGDLRILCRIEDSQLVILVVGIGNRGSIYR